MKIQKGFDDPATPQAKDITNKKKQFGFKKEIFKELRFKV